MDDKIRVHGAREHNLKNVDVDIPRNKFVVMTGLSGSGKSSLAFDTIYAEGQRRYVESLSSYARQFLGQTEKPDVDSIEGLSPAIAIDQKTTSRNPRSTVGTVTEIYDFLRLLYARVGHPHCPKCGKPIKKQTIDQIVDKILSFDDGTKCQILAPIVRGHKGQHIKLLETAMKSGFVRVRIDGEMYELDDLPELEKNKKHNIELVVDRIVIHNDASHISRITDSIETASKQSGGLILVDFMEKGEQLFSQNYSCPDCNIAMEELTPRMFSFNSPYGACPDCSGLGYIMQILPESIISDPKKSISEGALDTPGWNMKDSNSVATGFFKTLAKKYKFSLDTPVCDLDKNALNILLYGTGKEKIKVSYQSSTGTRYYETVFEGIIPTMERRYTESKSDYIKEKYEEFFSNGVCENCGGQRLKPIVLGVTVGDLNIAQLSNLSIAKCHKFLSELKLSKNETIIASQILRELGSRLSFLENVGLQYLTLSRSAGSLSGGEAQRIRLATQIGSKLTGVLYVLDEPSIGLHQRDNGMLLKTLHDLRDLGNTLIVVEHDEETIRSADYVIDVGPAAGIHGGEIVAVGTADEIANNPNSPTGAFLSGRESISVPDQRREPKGWLKVIGAKEHNLKNIDIEIPLGVIVCVTGVSGSGKSSLVREIVYKYLAHVLNRAKTKPGLHDRIEGWEQLDKIINIDQTPIGRTPRSNPATYVGVFDLIRKLFSQTPAAKGRGYKEGRFSFNVKGGRCEACKGDGVKKIEMHFLSDVYVTCDVCQGQRYNRETLEVKYNGKTIYDVLDMTVEQACTFFENIPRIYKKLSTLMDVGLGYIKLGQSSITLSGGEAQRVKLATELSRVATGRTIYVLDEPTTGLHSFDVKRLLHVLQCLVDKGNSMIIIEHNLDVIKTADYIIDLGPEGGEYGGELVCKGTPESIVKQHNSYTGEYLKKVLVKNN